MVRNMQFLDGEAYAGSRNGGQRSTPTVCGTSGDGAHCLGAQERGRMGDYGFQGERDARARGHTILVRPQSRSAVCEGHVGELRAYANTFGPLFAAMVTAHGDRELPRWHELGRASCGSRDRTRRVARSIGASERTLVEFAARYNKVVT